MSSQEKSKFLLFNVKPIWKVYYPSQLTGLEQSGEFIIYGVDRGALEINRNWIKVNSVEEYNQGFVPSPEDLTMTIAVKESGDAFEILRRLGKSATMFDIECDILREALPLGGNVEGEEDFGYTTWLDGYEQYLGCVINREGQTIDIGAFPVREFEIMFLRHKIKKPAGTTTKVDMVEGDGTFPALTL